MDFNVIKDSAMLILMFLVFGVPAVAIAARIAMRPILDAIKQVRPHAAAPDDARVAQLEAEVRRLSGEVKRLAEVESFNRQLQEGDR